MQFTVVYTSLRISISWVLTFIVRLCWALYEAPRLCANLDLGSSPPKEDDIENGDLRMRNSYNCWQFEKDPSHRSWRLVGHTGEGGPKNAHCRRM